MDERIPCKTAMLTFHPASNGCPRTEELCMPCVQARYRQSRGISEKQKNVDAFSGITNPVEMLKLVHEPREHDPLIEFLHPIQTDELYKTLR